LLEPKNNAPGLSASNVWATIDSARSVGLPDDAARLEATVALRKLLAADGAAIDPATIPTLSEHLGDIQSNASLYGTPDLRTSSTSSAHSMAARPRPTPQPHVTSSTARRRQIQISFKARRRRLNSRR
jgi:hypothetical protein